MLDILVGIVYYVTMYIDTVPNRGSRPTILLREGRREGKKVVKRTIANLTGWPAERVEGLRAVLKGSASVASVQGSFEVVRSRAHGHVVAVLGTVRRVGLERVLSARWCRERDLVEAMVVARIVEPASKLATARCLREETATSTLGEMLGVERVDEDALYGALDWLVRRQGRIEEALARRHLHGAVLVLYDLSSVYFEGRTCPLARYGHSRDGKRDKLQIVIGLLCTGEGIPVAVTVFEGNTGDPATLAGEVKRVRERFRIERIVFVGDRGLITDARIRQDLRGVVGLDWISALTAVQIRGLVEGGALQLSLFDERDLAEIRSPDYPGERLIACKNPLLAQERACKREQLLRATEKELDTIVRATHREKRPLRGTDRIGMRVGKVLGRFKVAKHFVIHITEESFTYERNASRIAQKEALDGIYVIRTSVTDSALLSPEQTVSSYKALSTVERAFRSLKTLDLHVRPIYHRLADRVRAHVLVCMLAYYVEWHMRKALAPLLFDDDDRATALAMRLSVVASAQRSPKARRKASTKRTEEGFPVHSFQTLLRDMATIVKNRFEPTRADFSPFETITRPTPLQQRALDLLGIRL
jgi:hypothetical protein